MSDVDKFDEDENRNGAVSSRPSHPLAVLPLVLVLAVSVVAVLWKFILGPMLQNFTF